MSDSARGSPSGGSASSGTAASGSLAPDRLIEALAALEPRARARIGSLQVVRAPGRVNLIGEHTDYNEGFVLPVAIDLEIRIAFLPTDDARVQVTLAETGEQAGFDLDRIGPPTGGWIDHIAGVAWSLAEVGVETRGFRGLLASNLPQSSGLSSSAALELAASWALSAAALDGLVRAQLCQRAENGYVGARVGLMDHVASSLGVAGAALLLDCRSLEWRPVELPLTSHALVVCDSGSPRRLLASDYNLRRAECEAAVHRLRDEDPSIRSLRDVTPQMLPSCRRYLDETLFRRCEHVVLENERVAAAVAALEAGDLASVGRLFAESHASLRDLFEVSSAELDALVAIATAVPGVVGARLTGGGFGGCTINLVARDAIEAFRSAVVSQYAPRTGLAARVFCVEAAAGAGRVA